MEEARVRKRNSEESDYSSINVHNARATQQQQLEEAERGERVEKECDTEASWLSMYMAALRQYLSSS